MNTAVGWKVRFERLYEAERDLVFNYVKGILRDSDMADDCTIEAFEEAFKSMKKGQVDQPTRAWIMTIARHRAYRHGKSRNWLASLSDHSDLPVDAKVDRKLMAEAELQTLLEPLNKEEREAIFMHDGLGLTHQEIGDIVGAPLGTVLARIFRGRKKIQLLLKEEHADVAV